MRHSHDNLVRVLVGLVIFAVGATAGFAQENRFALIIGNAAYAGTAELKNPVNDATAIAASLKRLGWKTTVVTNADRKRMSRAIASFRDTAASSTDPELLFYYAGHGMQIDGINYLIPVEEELLGVDDVKSDSISLSMVTDAIASAKASISLVILDACRDNPFAQTGSRSLAAGRGLTVVQDSGGKKGSAIMFATSPGEVAADGAGANGVFTAALIKHMESPLKIEDLFREVNAEVRKISNDVQKPWINASLSAEFYLMSPAMLEARKAAEKAAQEEHRIAELAKALDLARKADAERVDRIIKQAEADRMTAERAILEAQRIKAEAESSKKSEAAAVASETIAKAEAARFQAESALEKARMESAANANESSRKAAEVSAQLLAAREELERMKALVGKASADVLAGIDLTLSPPADGSAIVRVRARQISPGKLSAVESSVRDGSLSGTFLDDNQLFVGDPVNIPAGISTMSPGDWVVAARLENDSRDAHIEVLSLEPGARKSVVLPVIDYSSEYKLERALAWKQEMAPLVTKAMATKKFNNTVGTASGVGAILTAGYMALNIVRSTTGEDYESYMQLSSPKAVADWKYQSGSGGSPASSEYFARVFGTLGLSLTALSLFEFLTPVPNLHLAKELEEVESIIAENQKK